MAAPATQMATAPANEGTGTAQQAPVQTVVVVQQAAPVAQKPPSPTRFAYGYYAIAIGIWHCVMTFTWGILSGAEGGWGALFMFCGFVPSLGTIIWMIMDASTKCCGKGTDTVTICGCACANAKWVMAVPMAIFAFLRLILYGVMFGHFATWATDFDWDVDTDEIFWTVLFYACWDDGPIITLALDYWYIYGKNDDNGVMGTHRNPLRCVIAQASVMFVASWSLLVVVLESAGASDVWAWVMHGCISAAVLLYGIFCAFTGVVNGNTVMTSCSRMVWLGLAVAGGIGVIAVVIWFISEAGSLGVFAWLALYFYSAFSVPGVFAAAQFKVADPANNMATNNAV